MCIYTHLYIRTYMYIYMGFFLTFCMAWHRYGEIIGVDVFECLLSSEGNRDDAHFYSGYKIKVLKCLFSLEDYIQQ